MLRNCERGGVSIGGVYSGNRFNNLWIGGGDSSGLIRFIGRYFWQIRHLSTHVFTHRRSLMAFALVLFHLWFVNEYGFVQQLL
jgi:hypothetical protein